MDKRRPLFFSRASAEVSLLEVEEEALVERPDAGVNLAAHEPESAGGIIDLSRGRVGRHAPFERGAPRRSREDSSQAAPVPDRHEGGREDAAALLWTAGGIGDDAADYAAGGVTLGGCDSVPERGRHQSSVGIDETYPVGTYELTNTVGSPRVSAVYTLADDVRRESHFFLQRVDHFQRVVGGCVVKKNDRGKGLSEVVGDRFKASFDMRGGVIGHDSDRDTGMLGWYGGL